MMIHRKDPCYGKYFEQETTQKTEIERHSLSSVIFCSKMS
jgi:hypothetical protein